MADTIPPERAPDSIVAGTRPDAAGGASSHSDEAAIALQTHLDGDPNPRPGEIAKMRAQLARQQPGTPMTSLIILTPDEGNEDMPFPGYQAHGWKVFPDDTYEAEEVDITVYDVYDYIQRFPR